MATKPTSTTELVRVHWRDNRDGRSGHGEPMERSDGEAWVLAMNAEHPGIDRWLESAVSASVLKGGA